MTTKITKATFKSFVNKNRARLFIRCKSSFDGMTDCVEQVRNPKFRPAQPSELASENTLGINGVWLVGQSRDYFQEIAENGMKGIHVYNCCGSFDVAVHE
jgi:hypothetical protein